MPLGHECESWATMAGASSSLLPPRSFLLPPPSSLLPPSSSLLPPPSSHIACSACGLRKRVMVLNDG